MLGDSPVGNRFFVSALLFLDMSLGYGGVLHNLATEVAPALTAIFSQSIETGELPSQLKKAWIAPVFKKGSRAEAANYRPVSAGTSSGPEAFLGVRSLSSFSTP